MPARIQMFINHGEENILQLEQVYEVYKDEIAPIFCFTNSKREDFVNRKVLDFRDQYAEASDAENQAFAQLHLREKMAYQYRCFFVTQLYSLFEQQLLRCFRGEVRNGNYIKFDGSSYGYREFNKDSDFGYAAKCLDYIRKGSSIWWNDNCVKEINLLNNAIKHGFGSSFTKLHNECPVLINDKKYTFEDRPSSQDKPEKFTPSSKVLAMSTLFDDVFLLTDSNVEHYTDVLVKFWREGSLLSNGFYIAFD